MRPVSKSDAKKVQTESNKLVLIAEVQPFFAFVTAKKGLPFFANRLQRYEETRTEQNIETIFNIFTAHKILNPLPFCLEIK